MVTSKVNTEALFTVSLCSPVIQVLDSWCKFTCVCGVYVCMCVYNKALKDELTPLKKKLTEIDDIAGKLCAQLDPEACASITDRKTTLDDRIKDLESRLQQECGRLESTMDEHSQFAEKCQVIDTFLKTLPAGQQGVSAVDLPVVEQNISAAKETMMKIGSMQPEMARLNELSNKLSLNDDDSNRLTELKQRWEVACRDKEEEEKQLEERLQQLEKFSERCDEWIEFLTGVETDLQLPSQCSCESLLEQQQKTEVAVIAQFFL